MNNKEGNNRSGSRPSSSRPSSNKPNLHAKKATRPKKKAKIKKVAEVATDKVRKKANQAPKKTQGKDEIRLNKYISIQGFSS
jgi:23S rRNA pseudouridine2605 synthase